MIINTAKDFYTINLFNLNLQSKKIEWQDLNYFWLEIKAKQIYCIKIFNGIYNLQTT